MMMACNPVAKRPDTNVTAKGGTFTDTSINNYSTSVSGMTSDNGIFGEGNGSFLCNGLSEFATINTIASEIVSRYNSGLATTITFWFNGTHTGPGMVMGQSDYNTTSAFIVYVAVAAPIKLSLYTMKTGGFIDTTCIVPAVDVPQSTWFLATLHLKKGDYYWVINGVKYRGTDNAVDNMKTGGSNALYIGKLSSTINAFNNFNISNIRVTYQTLTAGQIKILNSQKGRLTA